MKIFITAQFPDKTMSALQQKFDCSISTKKGNINDLIAAEKKDFDGIITLLSDKITADFFNKFPSIKIIANYAVGFNNIDLKAASANGVVITNTPGVLTDTSADTAFALMMAVGRRIVEADQFVRTGNWDGWKPTQYLGKDIWGSKLGIVGLGRIGKALAQRARGFNMQINYWNRTRLTSIQEEKLGLIYMELDDLLGAVDFVSLHLAYTPETHHIIDQRKLGLMQKTAFIVNTARGAVIDEAALISALKNNEIAGAGLDVYEQEPKIPKDLLEMKNVVLLPHLGSASLATREKMGQLVIDNLSDFANGKTPRNPVNEL